MEEIFNSPLERLKIGACAVGISLILLVGVAIPLKFLLGQPGMLWFIPTVQPTLTCWFIMNTIKVAEGYQWKLGQPPGGIAQLFYFLRNFYRSQAGS